MTATKRLAAKIMLLGDIAVGKTSLAKRLVFDLFDTNYKTTIGVDVLTYDVPLLVDQREEKFRLILWDSDGDFSQKIFSTHYVLGAAGAIVVADASRPPSLKLAADLIDEFEQRFPGRPTLLIINKIDLLDSKTSASYIDLPTVDKAFASALTGEGVREAFGHLAQTLYRRLET